VTEAPKPPALRLSLDWSLPVLFGFLVWTLSVRYFPSAFYAPGNNEYMLAGFIASLGVLLSIYFHELGHAVAARLNGLRVTRIHLYALGGMAELKHRPLLAMQEAWIAVAGPLSSLVLAAIFYLPLWKTMSPVVYSAVHLLAITNLLVGGLNLLPVYPLDGGRMIRSFFWHRRGSCIESSTPTYRVSAITLAVLSLTALLFSVAGVFPKAYWLGVWLFYLGYMAMKGKKELFRVPEPDELILLDPDTFFPKGGESEIRMFRPVFADGMLQGVTHSETVEDGFMEIRNGRFIDVSRMETWAPSLIFEADIVPVFEGDRWLGYAEAHELRFWLLNGYHARLMKKEG
jgi:Zn-dependent protease